MNSPTTEGDDVQQSMLIYYKLNFSWRIKSIRNLVIYYKKISLILLVIKKIKSHVIDISFKLEFSINLIIMPNNFTVLKVI